LRQKCSSPRFRLANQPGGVILKGIIVMKVYIGIMYHINFAKEFTLPQRVVPVGQNLDQVKGYCLEFLRSECEDYGLPFDGVEIEWREHGSECTIGEDNMAYGYQFYIHKRFVI
jgi:hypothetical protein